MPPALQARDRRVTHRRTPGRARGRALFHTRPPSNAPPCAITTASRTATVESAQAPSPAPHSRGSAKRATTAALSRDQPRTTATRATALALHRGGTARLPRARRMGREAVPADTRDDDNLVTRTLLALIFVVPSERSNDERKGHEAESEAAGRNRTMGALHDGTDRGAGGAGSEDTHLAAGAGGRPSGDRARAGGQPLGRGGHGSD